MNSAMNERRIPVPPPPHKTINREAFLQILCSLNKGAYDTHYHNMRNVDFAVRQYNQLVDLGVIGGDKLEDKTL